MAKPSSFLGAGFSQGAIAKSGRSVPDAHELTSLLATRCGLDEGIGLQDAAEIFAERRGPDELVDFLKAEFTIATVTDVQRALMQYPWKRVYTTNFDNVAEVASRQVGKRRTAAVPSQDIKTLRSQPEICVHLNGYIGALSPTNLWDEFKLTDPSYLTGSLVDSPWLTVFRNDIRVSKATFFVGYSLTYDLDIRRVLFASGSKDKCLFIVGEHPSPQTELRAARAGSLYKETSEWLCAELNRTKETAGERPRATSFSTFERYMPPALAASVKDSDVFNLLVFGIDEPDLIWATLHDRTKKYALNRTPFSALCDDIRKLPGVFVLHADLGNGKTLALQILKAQLTEAGQAVYSLQRNEDEALNDIESILRSNPACVIMIESYGNCLDLVEQYCLHKTPESRLVLTARSATHDVLAGRLLEYTEGQAVREYDLNRLSAADIEWLVDYFEEYGLWGRMAGSPRHAKLRHLRAKCESECHSILLDLLESEAILAKLRDLAGSLSESDATLDLVVATLALTVLELRPEVHDLVNLLSPDTVRKVSLRADSALRQLFDFDKNFVRIRSTVTSRVLLTRVLNEDEVTTRLVNLFEVLSRNSGASRFNSTATTQMMRFGERLCPDFRGKVLA